MKRYFLAHWILPVAQPPLEHGFLAIENEVITDLGKIQDLPEALRAGYSFETNQQILTPGLINTHAHLEHSFGAAIPVQAGESMSDWLCRVIQKVMSAPSEAEKQQRALRGAQEMLAAGTTCVNDISADGASISALAALKMRGVISLEFFHPAWETLQLAPIIERYQKLQSLCSPHALLTPGLSPHSPYNVSPAAWQGVVAACRPSVLHTHLAESGDETAWVQGVESPLHRMHQTVLQKTFQPQTSGYTPTAYLHHHGLLNEKLIAAHAVETNAAERLLLQQHGVRIAHCPRSNLFLQGKTLSWQDWRNTGIPMGLGTDSHLSNQDLDLRAEARVAMEKHGFSSAAALEYLTHRGAQVLGLDHAIGSLEVEKQADLVVWVVNQAISSKMVFDVWLQPETCPIEVVIQGNSCYSQVPSYAFSSIEQQPLIGRPARRESGKVKNKSIQHPKLSL